MITQEDFSKLLSMECDVLLAQTADLTHSDSLIQPKFGGNCLNWTIGHLVDNLVEILNVLGGNIPPDLPDLAHYGYGSEPICSDAAGVIELPILIEHYKHFTTMITDRLSQMTNTDFDQEIEFWQGKNRRGYVAFFYFFHNTYHLGQLEQLRNMAGKTEKVL